ncbi:MAG: glycosyltransferase, partial [Pirellulales bacterium]
MKIVLFADLKAENWHSMDRYAECVARCLQTYGSNGRQIELFWPDRADRRSDDQRVVKTRPFVENARLGFARYVAYCWQARAARGELNHVLDHTYAHVVHFLPPERTIVTCHDLDALALGWKNRTLPGRAVSAWARRGLVKAARIITVSENTRQDVIRLLGFQPEHVRAVHHGVPPEFSPTAGAEDPDWR